MRLSVDNVMTPFQPFIFSPIFLSLRRDRELSLAGKIAFVVADIFPMREANFQIGIVFIPLPFAFVD